MLPTLTSLWRARELNLQNRRRWGRLFAVGAAGTLVGVGLTSMANGSPALPAAVPTTDTTDVAFVTIPAKQVWRANSIAAGATESVAVIGGTTTVPSNATTVHLVVTVKGAAAGNVILFPAGNLAGGAGHSIAWTAGGSTLDYTAENVGLSNKVSVTNNSAKAAAVTIVIDGYSTQVVAGDINGSGGAAGQVLTNNGTGGATWSTPGTAYGAPGGFSAVPMPVTVPTMVASVSVPAGSYFVSFTGTAEAVAVGGSIYCTLLSPANSAIGLGNGYIAGNPEGIAVQGLTKTTGGSVRARCTAVGNTATMYYPTLTVVEVGAVSGAFVP